MFETFLDKPAMKTSILILLNGLNCLEIINKKTKFNLFSAILKHI